MLKGVSETLDSQTQHPIHLDPVIAALYENLERIDSVSKLVKSLTHQISTLLRMRFGIAWAKYWDWRLATSSRLQVNWKLER